MSDRRPPIDRRARLASIAFNAGVDGELVGERFLASLASGWAVIDLRCDSLSIERFGNREPRRLLLDAPPGESMAVLGYRLREGLESMRSESLADAVDSLRQRFWERAESSGGSDLQCSESDAYRSWATELRLHSGARAAESFDDSWYQRTREWCSGDLRLD